MDKQVKLLYNITPEEFYNDTMSVYIRCTYMPEKSGYKVLVYNQMNTEEMGEDQIKLCLLARGLAELAVEQPSEVYEVGYQCALRDTIDTNTDLDDNEKELLKNPIGSA